MTFFKRQANLLSILLVVLLCVQVNALPIHEFNLRQQGYTLVYVPVGEWSGTTAYQSVNGSDVYNIALCDTHFRLQAMAEYEQLAFMLALLALLGLSLLSCLSVRTTWLPFSPYQPTLYSRAPPVRAVPA